MKAITATLMTTVGLGVYLGYLESSGNQEFVDDIQSTVAKLSLDLPELEVEEKENCFCQKRIGVKLTDHPQSNETSIAFRRAAAYQAYAESLQKSGPESLATLKAYQRYVYLDQLFQQDSFDCSF